MAIRNSPKSLCTSKKSVSGLNVSVLALKELRSVLEETKTCVKQPSSHLAVPKQHLIAAVRVVYTCPQIRSVRRQCAQMGLDSFLFTATVHCGPGSLSPNSNWPIQ